MTKKYKLIIILLAVSVYTNAQNLNLIHTPNGMLRLESNDRTFDIGHHYPYYNFRIQNQFGYLDLGAVNNQWAAFDTDKEFFIFNKPVSNLKIHTFINADNKLDFRVNNITRMLIDANGNVGVGTGTTTLTKRFHVVGDSHFDGNVEFGSGSSQLFKFGGKTHFTDNAGIGVAPSTTNKLQVQGVTYLNGNLRVGTVTTAQPVALQIGNVWTFHDGPSNKIIGWNNYWNGSNFIRIQQGAASKMTFNSSGDIEFQTAGDGSPDSNISTWNTVVLKNNGSVGIGTTNPSANKKLHVAGDTYLNGRLGVATDNPLVQFQIGNIWTFHDGSSNKIIGRNTYYNGSNNVRIIADVASRMYFSGSGDIVFQTVGSGSTNSIISSWNTVTIKNNGNVGIGTTNTFGYKLAVNGTIGAKKIKVENTSAWGDFVFDDDYKLLELSEVEKFVKENRHLPEIPSAREIDENGIDIGEMQNKLLIKIEELTLHAIEQQKLIKALTKRITELETTK